MAYCVCTTKDNHQGQADPKHRVDFSMSIPNPGNLGKGGSNDNGRGDKYVVELERREKQDDGEQIEEKFHDGLIIRLPAMTHVRLPIIKAALL